MLTLYELQHQFVQALYHNENNILSVIQSTQSMTAQEHLDIYKKSIFGALQKALKEIFPVCYKLVGHDFFMAMANEYIKIKPSSSPDIGDYGYSFPEFIANFVPAKILIY